MIDCRMSLWRRIFPATVQVVAAEGSHNANAIVPTPWCQQLVSPSSEPSTLSLSCPPLAPTALGQHCHKACITRHRGTRHAPEAAAVVAEDDAVRIQHGHDLEDVRLKKLGSLRRRAKEKV